MKKTAALFIVALLAVTSTGCQFTGTATTQPSLATITTDTENALDLAVNLLHTGLDLKVITPATYVADIAPAVHAAQSAVAAMRRAANAGDQSATQTASDAAFAALAQLKPYLTAVQTAAKKAK